MNPNNLGEVQEFPQAQGIGLNNKRQVSVVIEQVVNGFVIHYHRADWTNDTFVATTPGRVSEIIGDIFNTFAS